MDKSTYNKGYEHIKRTEYMVIDVTDDKNTGIYIHALEDIDTFDKDKKHQPIKFIIGSYDDNFITETTSISIAMTHYNTLIKEFGKKY